MGPRAYDIVVIGGGIAGCCAATAAARAGREVLLIEHYGFLGGWATAALVNPFMSHCASDGKPLVAGLYEEIRARLRDLGSLLGNCFDSEVMKTVLLQMTLESGARLRLHTYLDSAAYEPDGSILVTTHSKSGPERFRSRVLIDCSGDGDAAVSLGARFEMGDEQGLPQAVTLMFDVGGVDLQRAMTYVRDHPDQMLFPKLAPDADPAALARGVISVAGYYDLVAQAREDGEYDVPGDLIFYVGRPRGRSLEGAHDQWAGEVVFNTTHVGGIDPTNAEDLTRAQIEGRRQMMSVVSFVRKRMPGFESSYLLRSAPHVGVRETRRVTGEYVFGAEDVVEGRKFQDAICRLAYPVDVHSGRGDGYTRKNVRAAPRTPPPGDWYEIPYRCLVPLEIENVLVAGRCVSSTQAGHGAIRIMPSCAAMGQAAGTAAALAVASGTAPRRIDTRELVRQLAAQGAICSPSE